MVPLSIPKMNKNKRSKNNKIPCSICCKEIKSNHLRKYCDDCIKKYNRNTSSLRMIRNRKYIKNYKEGKVCEICGYCKYPQILAFHHKRPSNKSREINKLMKSLSRLDIINKEIKKCILVCPNCHQELHLKEGGLSKYE